MTDLSLLVWITQLGLSVALPPIGFILLAKWLQEQWGWGDWVLWAGIVIGIICAADGFIHALRTLLRSSKEKKDDKAPPISFHDHD